MMEGSTVRGLAKERWLRLGKWSRQILTIVAVLVGVVWVAIASIVLIVLADSPLHCPPTMGCVDRKTKECTPWRAFMQSETTRGSCDSSR